MRLIKSFIPSHFSTKNIISLFTPFLLLVVIFIQQGKQSYADFYTNCPVGNPFEFYARPAGDGYAEYRYSIPAGYADCRIITDLGALLVDIPDIPRPVNSTIKDTATSPRWSYGTNGNIAVLECNGVRQCEAQFDVGGLGSCRVDPTNGDLISANCSFRDYNFPCANLLGGCDCQTVTTCTSGGGQTFPCANGINDDADPEIDSQSAAFDRQNNLAPNNWIPDTTADNREDPGCFNINNNEDDVPPTPTPTPTPTIAVGTCSSSGATLIRDGCLHPNQGTGADEYYPCLNLEDPSAPKYNTCECRKISACTSPPNSAWQCDDGQDNDGNGCIDWQQDRGCDNMSDSTERNGGATCRPTPTPTNTPMPTPTITPMPTPWAPMLRVYCNNGICNTGLGPVPTTAEGITSWALRIIMGIAGGVALLLLLLGAFKWVTGGGDPKALDEAKDTITAALSGLFLIVFSVLILKIIGVDILGLPGFEMLSGGALRIPGT